MKWIRMIIGVALVALAALVTVALIPRADAITTVPLKHVYNGHLLDASGNAISTEVTVRFSFWTSADFVSGNVTGTGAIDTTASTYASWNEVHTVTPNSDGYFTVNLGSVTALPAIDTTPLSTILNLFIQVEVKDSGDPDTSYELLDIKPSDGTVDRSPVLTVPFAQNADFIDQREPGIGSGDLLILGPGGFVNVSQMGSGTTFNSWTIDADDTATSTITLKFGDTLGKDLTYNIPLGRFFFDDDVTVQGNLSGVSLTVSSLKNCDTLDTDGSGNLICGDDNAVGTGLSITEGDDRYVNISGDTMTGGLAIHSTAGLTLSGRILTESGLVINSDNSPKDAIITFGNDLGAETIRFSDAQNQFVLSDDLTVQGAMSGTSLTLSQLRSCVTVSTDAFGNLICGSISALQVSSGAGLSVSVASGSYRINGNLTNFSGSSSVVVPASSTSYLFFTSTGLTVTVGGFPTDKSFIPLAEVQTSGTVVTKIIDRRVPMDDDREQTIQRVYHPVYEHAIYKDDGTSNVGQLKADHDDAVDRNYYVWTSTRSSLQDYDILLRIPLSTDFVRWKSTPIRVTYRSSTASAADNKLDISVFDTAGAAVTLVGSSGSLASTSWATTDLNFSGSPTWTPGSGFLIRFRVSAKSQNEMHLGELRLEYVDLLKE